MFRLSFTIILLFALVLPASGSLITSDLQEYLETAEAGAEIPIIIDFFETVDLQTLGFFDRPVDRASMVRTLKKAAERNQSPVRDLLGWRGKRFRDLWIINSLALHADESLILALAEQPEIKKIRLDGIIKAEEPIQNQQPAAGWNLQAIQAPDLWAEGFTGEDVVIAVFDSGVDLRHAAIGSKWRGGADDWFNPYAAQCSTAACTPCEASGETPCDDETGEDRGHGTAVTGILLGGEIDGEPIGVAPGAQWIAAKIFRDDGTASLSFIHEAFQWILDHPDPPDLVNGSWGFESSSGECDGEYRPDVQALRNAGIGVVFSAGNTGPDPASSISPANYPESLAVGSTGSISSLFEVSPFSARGPSACDGSIYPDSVAPGFHIRTAAVTMGGLTPEAVGIVSGTSFAAPHVTGVLALLRNAFPELSMSGLEAALLQSAEDLGEAGADQAYGSGMLNALAAHHLLMGIPNISLHDPIAPANDLILDFGSVSPGGEVLETVVIQNAGSGLLRIEEIDTSALGPPFFLSVQDCTDISLGEEESCSLSIRFAPPSHEAYQGEILIRSNDPDENLVILSITGAGNSPPFPPLLVSPENQATGLSGPVVFQWIHQNDPDDDPVSDTLLLSKLGDFSDRILIGGESDASPRRMLTASAGSVLWLLGIIGIFCRGIRPSLKRMIVLSGLALLVSCGGGGGGNGDADPGNMVERTVTSLDPDSVYHWKVVSEDSLGGTSESEVRSFRTR